MRWEHVLTRCGSKTRSLAQIFPDDWQYSNPTDFAFSIRWIFVLEVIIRYDPYLQLRCAVWHIAVVVDGEVQLIQQDAPAAGVVVLGDGIPATGWMRAAGVIVLGADRLDA